MIACSFMFSICTFQSAVAERQQVSIEFDIRPLRDHLQRIMLEWRLKIVHVMPYHEH